MLNATGMLDGKRTARMSENTFSFNDLQTNSMVFISEIEAPKYYAAVAASCIDCSRLLIRG